jgi:hypothetical protein
MRVRTTLTAPPAQQVLWNFRVVKALQQAAMSAAGLRICTDYHLTAGKDEDVVDAGFMHQKFSRAGIVQATAHDVFSCTGMDLDD